MVVPSIIVLIVIYAEYRHLVHYAECRYAECRGALNEGIIKLETLANSAKYANYT